MRWLVVSPYLPHPAIGHGGGTAVLQLLEAVAKQHQAMLLCFEREAEAGLDAHLRARGVEVHTVPFASEQARGVRRLPVAFDRMACALRSVSSSRPMMAVKYDRPSMHHALLQIIEKTRPDVIQIEYSFMAGYARSARIHVDAGAGLWQKSDDRAVGFRPHILLNTHELGTLPRLRRLAHARTNWVRRQRLARDLAIWAAHDRRCVDGADTVLCVTEQDRSLLAALTGAANLRTVPLGTAVAELPTVHAMPRVAPPRLLFVGSFGHTPNLEGMNWFCERVMPLIWQQRDDVVLDIVGRDAPSDLSHVADASRGRIRLLGFVDDLDACFEASWLFVAPLISGGGIKIKVLEAMGRGAAVVTTPIGAEGIDEAGEASVLARDADEFAGAVLSLLDSEPERSALGARAREWIERRFGWAGIVRELARIVDEGQKD